MEINSCKTSSDLTISIDWISFTCDVSISKHTLIRKLGYQFSDFKQIDRGAMGYKKQLKHSLESVTIFYDGNEDMGVHLRITGRSVTPVIEQYYKTLEAETPFVFPHPVENLGDNPLTFAMLSFFRCFSEFGHFTRIDLAIDDLGNNYFTLDDVFSLLYSGRAVSKFRSWQNLVEYRFDGSKKGHTINLGSRQSNIFLRIYDKKLEQLEKGNKVNAPWVRWELELKGSYADKVGRELTCQSMGLIAIGILSNYLRFIESDNKNKSRCSVLPQWQKFIGEVEKLGLYIKPGEKTLDQKERWFNRQVSSTFSALVMAHGGDIDYIYDKVQFGLLRMSKALREKANQYLEMGDNK